MGHLTRSISILKELSLKNRITFFGNEEQIHYLKKESIPLEYKIFPDYNLNFKGKSFLVEMILNSPRMIQAIQQENQLLQKEQNQEKFDVIISDNRFGFRVSSAKSIILTHQLNIKSPIFEKQGSKLNQIYLNKFDEVWVPDFEDHRYSGDLSKAKLDSPTHFLGNISDLSAKQSEKAFDYLVIASGPEPYKSNFMEKLIAHLSSFDKKIAVAGWISESKNFESIVFLGLLNRKEMQNYICKSEKVIAKAGYTTLLDLEKTKTEAILIPTPKQYEQEYLSQYLKNHPRFTFKSENEISSID